jgi:Coenzyme PQQ synthesis protein D (PqqD)
MNGNQGRKQGSGAPLPSPSKSVRFFPFWGGGVLFFAGTQRIWVLNAACASIWCLLPEAGSLEELAAALAARFAIDETTARRDALAALATFEREELLAGGRPPQPDPGVDRDALSASGPPLVDPPAWGLRRLLRTPGRVFEFCSTEAAYGDGFVRILSHLAPEMEEPADTRLAVLAGRRGLDIYLDGRRWLAEISGEELLPQLFALFCRCACEALQQRLLLHAAVLGRGNKLALFPAEAGGGKTTLAAILAARGFHFFSDELAVLDVEDLGVSPLPLPMTIKPGSLAALGRHFPGLADLPAHRRADGKTVRYLAPPPASLLPAGAPKAVVRAIVFPGFIPGAATRLAGLDKVEALRRLARTGSSTRDYRTGDIRAMIALVERNPCFELCYSDPEEAALLVEKYVFD